MIRLRTAAAILCAAIAAVIGATWIWLMHVPTSIADEDGRPTSIEDYERSVVVLAVLPTHYELSGETVETDQELLAALRRLPSSSHVSFRWAVNAADTEGKVAVSDRLWRAGLAVKAANLRLAPGIGNEVFH